MCSLCAPAPLIVAFFAVCSCVLIVNFYILTVCSGTLTVGFWMQDILALLTREEVVRQLTAPQFHACNHRESILS